MVREFFHPIKVRVSIPRNKNKLAIGELTQCIPHTEKGPCMWKPWPSGTVLPGHAGGAGFEPPRGDILCSPSSSEETINRGPHTPIPTMHALICEELKDPGIPPKVVP